MTAAVTNKDLSKLRIWQVATFYVGTPNSPAPTAVDSVLDDSFTGLGFLAPAGIVESEGQTVSEETVYEGYVARSILTAGSYSLATTLSQNIQAVLEQIYAAKVGTDGSIIVDPLRMNPRLPWVVDLEDDDGVGTFEQKRIWAPSAQGRRNGDSTYVKTASTGFPLIVMTYAHPSLEYDTTTGQQGTVKIWDSSFTAAT